MSWLYSQALVEAYSAATCSDGEPFAPLNGSPIPQAFCAPDKMTKFSRLSRFGMTFKPLTGDRGEELLTWFLAGFPAKTSVQQDEAPESTASAADCGSTWRESLGRYDPSTHTLKTAQCSLFADSTESSPTLPRWGLMRTGELYQRQTLVRPTSATESGLLPTPLASNTKAHHMRSGGWPARSYLLWPTPQASDNRNRGNADTPSIAKRISTGKQVTLTMTVSGGQLNPTWVEWLMGWPLGWTDLKPLETGKFQQWLQQHGVY